MLPKRSRPPFNPPPRPILSGAVPARAGLVSLRYRQFCSLSASQIWKADQRASLLAVLSYSRISRRPSSSLLEAGQQIQQPNMDSISQADDLAQSSLYPVANISNPANHGFQAAVRTIFRRCVECPTMDPTCPPCKSNEACVQVFGGCNSCSENKCVPQAQSGGTINQQPSSSSGPNVGAIVGGVLGGVAVIALVTFLIWRFCLRGRKDDMYDPEEEEKETTSYGHHTDTELSSQAARRQSTRSVASSVMTRASNVIQIAFIPGIQDRAEDIPPVPQLPHQPLSQRSYSGSMTSSRHEEHTGGSPIAMTPYRDRSPGPGTPQSAHGDEQEHYFTPHDLRMQRYSQFSDETDTLADGRSTRYRSMASLTPSLARSSVASTVRHDQMPPMPAQAAQMIARGRAAVVSVKPGSNQNTPQPDRIHEMPSPDYFKYGQANQDLPINSSPVTRSSAPHDESADAVAELSGHSNPRSNQVAAAIEEATRRASARPVHGGLGSLNTRNREGSPRGLRPREGSPMSSRMRDVSPLASSVREHSSREGSMRGGVSSRSDPSLRETATGLHSARAQSPLHTRPGTGHSREAGPFSDKHAATPP